MNKHKFIEYLRDPSKIKDSEVSELDQLVKSYPYFQGARALRAKVAKTKKLSDFNEKVASAAVYATDRALLKRYINDHLFIIHSRAEQKPVEPIVEAPPAAKAPKAEAAPSVKTKASKSKKTAASAKLKTKKTQAPKPSAPPSPAKPSQAPPKDFSLDELIEEIYSDIEDLKKSKARFMEVEKQLEEEEAVNAAIIKAANITPLTTETTTEEPPITEAPGEVEIETEEPAGALDFTVSEDAEQEDDKHHIAASETPTDSATTQETTLDEQPTSTPAAEIEEIDVEGAEAAAPADQEEREEPPGGVVEALSDEERFAVEHNLPLNPSSSEEEFQASEEAQEEEAPEKEIPEKETEEHVASEQPVEEATVEEEAKEEEKAVEEVKEEEKEVVEPSAAEKKKAKRTKAAEAKVVEEAEEKAESQPETDPSEVKSAESPKEEATKPTEEPISDTLKVVRRRAGKVQSTKYESRKTDTEEEKIIDEFITKSPSISKPKETADPESKKDLADKSTRFQADIATEYLAEIYVEQGKIERAISIYTKLGLKFPEKKSFFAARIEELKAKGE